MGLLTSATSVLLIIFGFGVLIFVHELGHFLAAKWAGIRTEAFAVGMGPVMASWRKGIGFAAGSTERAVKRLSGKSAHELSEEELAKHGLGETEYSLRWLPLGGFVKMLGQEDLNPAALSGDPRSYNCCPIPKRMVVVSAGVIMNILLALGLFVVAFLVGVQSEAPIVGAVSATAPAGVTTARNAASLGIDAPGLAPGDQILTIDGKPVRTFADIRLATAMARPEATVPMTVERAGVAEPLAFDFIPTPGPEGLLSIGIDPARSTLLSAGSMAVSVNEYLAEIGLEEAGVEAGMRLVTANGQPLSTFGELTRVLDTSDGRPVKTEWTAVDRETGAAVGSLVTASLPTTPRFQRLFQTGGQGELVYDPGLVGLSPIIRVASVDRKSPNKDTLLPGDVIVRAAEVAYPRWTQLRAITRRHARGAFALVVRREGQDIEIEARVNRDGQLGVGIDWDEATTVITAPVETVRERGADEDGRDRTTPAAALDLLPGTRIARVGSTPVEDWAALRAALVDATASARERALGGEVILTVVHPTPGREEGTVKLALSARDVSDLHALGWRTALTPIPFEPIYTTLSAGGNPLRAAAMGFHETHKTMLMTYLTIDRLIRGSVGVEQVRGPVGIIDLGARILPRGFMYFIFFLGIISVNLAVINFLPLPIVDGGLFLFLVYEKLKGKPPSVQFQNAATVIGLFLIGTVFVVTFYNDIVRLVS